MKYNPNNWYWIVNNSNTVVYSSAQIAFVPMNDATYQAWLNNGGSTTRILNATELFEVLQNQWLPNYLANGVAVESTGSPSLNATYSMDAQSQFNISGISTGIASGKGLPGGGSTFIYNGIEFNATQFLNLASALENYVYNFNIALATLLQTQSGTMPSVPLIIA